MQNYFITVTKPSGETTDLEYRNTNIVFEKSSSNGYFNQNFPQNFDLLEPLYTSENDLVLKKIYHDLGAVYEDNIKLSIRIQDTEDSSGDILEIFNDYAYFLSYTLLTPNDIPHGLRERTPALYYGSLRVSNKQEMM